jgi:hypothetical protein
MPSSVSSTHAQSAPSPTAPGVILLGIAFLSAVVVSVPIVGTLYVLSQYGVLSSSAILNAGFIAVRTLFALLSPPNPLQLAVVVPTALLTLFAITFLIAFVRRSRWGPRVTSCLALIWSVSTAINIPLVPALAMPGGLPTLTLLAMIPAMLAPMLFALGFAGFVLKSDVALRWFSKSRKGAGQ